MGLFGDLVTGALGGFPTIPNAPQAPNVDPQKAQLASIRGNAAALPGLEDLGGDINMFNLQQRAKALDAGIPGYGNIVGAGSNLLQQQLAGVIPDDVSAQVGRRTNAQAFAGGYQGSGMAGNLTARDLGLTSYDIQRQGQAAAPGWLGAIGALAVPNQFDVTSGMISPAQQIGAEQWNEQNRFNTQWLQNQLDSIPDPETAAIAKDVGGITDLVATAALAWAGGAIGGAVGGASGGMMGGQLGGMIGGGGGPGSADLGSLIGQLSQSGRATVPAYSGGYGTMPDYYMDNGSGLSQSMYSPYSLGGYDMGANPFGSYGGSTGANPFGMYGAIKGY